MEEREYEAPLGHISNAITTGLEYAKMFNCIAIIKFNGIGLRIHPDSRVGDIGTIYDLKCELRRNSK